jgi:hypothetical protein
VTFVRGAGKILPTIKVDGHSIYKPTHVSQLNDNFFLSKDRLARLYIAFNSTSMIIVSKRDLHMDQVCCV